MKQNKFRKNQEPAGTSPPAPTVEVEQIDAGSKPSTADVAARAYSKYLNQGSLPGHDKQHWLEAEAQLAAERNLAKVYLFHNWTE